MKHYVVSSAFFCLHVKLFVLNTWCFFREPPRVPCADVCVLVGTLCAPGKASQGPGTGLAIAAWRKSSSTKGTRPADPARASPGEAEVKSLMGAVSERVSPGAPSQRDGGTANKGRNEPATTTRLAHRAHTRYSQAQSRALLRGATLHCSVHCSRVCVLCIVSRSARVCTSQSSFGLFGHARLPRADSACALPHLRSLG